MLLAFTGAFIAANPRFDPPSSPCGRLWPPRWPTRSAIPFCPIAPAGVRFTVVIFSASSHAGLRAADGGRFTCPAG
jgi:hypothetical protein